MKAKSLLRVTERAWWLITIASLVFLAAGCSSPAPTATPAPTAAPPPTSAPAKAAPTSAPAAAPTSAPTSAPAPAAKPAQAVTMKVASKGAVGYFGRAVIERTMKLIDEKAPGYFKYDYYPGESLYKAQEQLAATRQNVIQMGQIVESDFGSELGALAAFEFLPMGFEVDKFIKHYRDPGGLHDLSKAYFAKLGIVPLARPVGAGIHFFEKKGPVKTIEDLKGKLWRASTGADVLQSFGVRPVNVASSETYQAVQQGIITGGIISVANIVSYRLHEQAKYLAIVYFTISAQTVIMNQGFLNGLPPNIQQIILDSAAQAEKEEFATAIPTEQKGIEGIKAKGMEVYDWPPSELQKFQNAAKATWSTIGKNYSEWGDLMKLQEKISQ